MLHIHLKWENLENCFTIALNGAVQWASSHKPGITNLSELLLICLKWDSLGKCFHALSYTLLLLAFKRFKKKYFPLFIKTT